MFVAEQVLLLLVISLTDNDTVPWHMRDTMPHLVYLVIMIINNSSPKIIQTPHRVN